MDISDDSKICIQLSTTGLGLPSTTSQSEMVKLDEFDHVLDTIFCAFWMEFVQSASLFYPPQDKVLPEKHHTLTSGTYTWITALVHVLNSLCILGVQIQNSLKCKLDFFFSNYEENKHRCVCIFTIQLIFSVVILLHTILL